VPKAGEAYKFEHFFGLWKTDLAPKLALQALPLWHMKRWGIIFLTPLPIAITLSSIVVIVYVISAGEDLWRVFPATFLVAGGTSWCIKLFQLHRQVSE
jgi:hypothetical protein